MKCSKCGKEIEGEYCDFYSDVLDGSKFCLDVASKVPKELLNRIPIVNIAAGIISFALGVTSKAIPNEVRKYKCDCGHTWYKFTKQTY